MVGVRQFAIYLAKFPFLESAVQKVRPVIAVSKAYGKRQVVIVVPVSSQQNQTEVDMILNDWQKSGLLKPSVARVHRLAAVLQSNLKEEVGDTTSRDRQELKAGLRRLLELQ